MNPEMAKLMITPDYSRLQFRAITLPNSLSVSLMHDPDATDSAIALSVFTGSVRDPEDRNGLNHFLEHMLFISTEKYPKEDDFQQFLTNQGGMYNGFTSDRNVSYFLTVKTKSFSEAIDRFSSFFICPTFNEDAADREVNAIQNEHSMHLNTDGYLISRVIDSCLDPHHPKRKYPCGTKETITSGGQSPKETVKTLRQLFATYYNAPNMRLAMYSELPLDEQEALVKQFFSDIPSTPVMSIWDEFIPKNISSVIDSINTLLSDVEYDLASSFHINKKPEELRETQEMLQKKYSEMGDIDDTFTMYLKQDHPTIPFPERTFDKSLPRSSVCVIVGKQPQNILSLRFPVPLIPASMGITTGILGMVVGHESEGSLLSLLKIRGLATSLSAGVAEDYLDFKMFLCDIVLTENGLNHLEDVITLFFETISLLSSVPSPLPPYLYNESSLQSAQHCHQTNSERPFSAALGASMVPLVTPKPFVFAQIMRGRVFSEKLFRDIMKYIRPDTMLSFLIVPVGKVGDFITSRIDQSLLGKIAEGTELFDSLDKTVQTAFGDVSKQTLGSDKILSCIAPLLKVDPFVNVLHFFIPFNPKYPKIWAEVAPHISPQLKIHEPNPYLSKDLSLHPIFDCSELHRQTSTKSTKNKGSAPVSKEIRTIEAILKEHGSILHEEAEHDFCVDPFRPHSLSYTPILPKLLPVVLDSITINTSTDPEHASRIASPTGSPTVLTPLYPILVLNQPGLRVYYKQSTANRTPIIAASIQIETNNKLDKEVIQTGKTGAMRLFSDLLVQKLNEKLYEMEMGSLEVTLNRNDDGFVMNIVGTRSNIRKGVELIASEFFRPSFSYSLFERVKRTRLDNLRTGMHGKPYQLAMQLRSIALSPEGLGFKPILEGTENLKYEDMMDLAKRIGKSVNVMALVNGNCGIEEAVEIVKVFCVPVEEGSEEQKDTTVAHPTILPPNSLSENRVVVLPPAKTFIIDHIHPKPSETNSSVLVSSTLTTAINVRAAILSSLLNTFLSPHIFNRLRTKETLGYLVTSFPQPSLWTTGLAILVQGAGHDVCVLQSRIMANMEAILNEELRELSDEEFAAIKAGLIHNSMKKASSISAEVEWSAEAMPREEWMARMEHSGVIKQIQKRELQEFCVMLWGGKDRLTQWREGQKSDETKTEEELQDPHAFNPIDYEDPTHLVVRVMPQHLKDCFHKPSSLEPFVRSENDAESDDEEEDEQAEKDVVYPPPLPPQFPVEFIDDPTQFRQFCSLSPNFRFVD
ncbi:putative Insulin-degrading enzyme [Blattamonas nauphoetae]|uniref:Insulin-degrading enzyme n=1 Tax=Blattamonas nauphoetae TaxID=2049346 RepID=A0ABQ9WMV1_9EUKA|nr:putative Insulin-degrading enzyme [Blattamonas nauphoetae]